MGKGSNSSRLGRYNKSILLTELRRAGQASKAMLTQQSGLSAQAVTRIVDELERSGLVRRRGLQRGGKGQPSQLYSIDPGGAYAIGIKVGRRGMEMLLMDFGGAVLGRIDHYYRWPDPEFMLPLIANGLKRLTGRLDASRQRRLTGVGVAMPWFIGEWSRELGMDETIANKWRNLDFAARMAEMTELPVLFENDDSAAAIGEVMFGHGTRIASYVYVYLGTFVGGGIVINGNLEPGANGNSGALASMPVPPSRLAGRVPGERAAQTLLHRASLFLLQRHLAAHDHAVETADEIADLPADAEPVLQAWMDDCADALVHALLGAISVLDPEAIIIDSQLPRSRVESLAMKVDAGLQHAATSGVILPRVLAGTLGADAHAMGAAILPFYSSFVLDRTVLLTGGVPRRIPV